MVIVELVLQKEKKKNLVEDLDGVRFVAVILPVYKNMISIYADSVLEKLQTLWDSKNYGDMLASN